jgi:predicted dienelactone hydrolase
VKAQTHKQTLIYVAASLALALALAPACSSGPASAPAPAAPPAPPPAAELARSGLAVVAEADVTLHGSPGGGDLAVHVTYPQGGEPVPVVVFSHGAGGSGGSYRPLLRFWATRGYAILAPSHGDSAGARRRDRTLEARESAADAPADPKAWTARVKEATLTVASLPEIEASVPALRGRLDGRRLGVGGHSVGAFTAQLLAGATVNVPRSEKGKSYADPQPRAFLLLSPQGRGQQGLTEASWRSLERPLMVVTGTRDRGPKGQAPSWRLDPFRLSPPGDKFAVLLDGASHLSFTGRAAEPGATTRKGAASADEEVAIFRALKIATLAFWDAFLREDAAAKAFLESDVLATETGGKAKIERR